MLLPLVLLFIVVRCNGLDRELRDVFQVQDDITQAIVTSLTLTAGAVIGDGMLENSMPYSGAAGSRRRSGR